MKGVPKINQHTWEMCGKHIWVTINSTAKMKIINFQLFGL